MEEIKYTAFSHSWFDPWKDEDITCEYNFRKPARSEVNRFNKEVQKSSTAAQRNLLVTVVEPGDKDRLLADLEEYPALTLTVVSWVLKSSGLSNDAGN